MILVDTSVLIPYLRGAESDATNRLGFVIAAEMPYGICSQIYQELLQGARSQRDYDALKEYLDTLDFFAPRDPRESYANAAALYFRCRKRGKTIRSSIDCVIAQTAIENELRLLHNDRDFEYIRSVDNRLEFF